MGLDWLRDAVGGSSDDDEQDSHRHGGGRLLASSEPLADVLRPFDSAWAVYEKSLGAVSSSADGASSTSLHLALPWPDAVLHSMEERFGIRGARGTASPHSTATLVDGVQRDAASASEWLKAQQRRFHPDRMASLLPPAVRQSLDGPASVDVVSLNEASGDALGRRQVALMHRFVARLTKVSQRINGLRDDVRRHFGVA
mgnify:FL=1